MPAGYYDLYAEAGSIFVIKLNYLDANGASASLIAPPYYVPEELKGIGWGHVASIKAVLQVKAKPNATATGVSLLTFKSNWASGEKTSAQASGQVVGDIQFEDSSTDPTTDLPRNDHNIKIWTIDPAATSGTPSAFLGTHFYDLELEFTGGPGPSGGTNSIKLRILQGRFTITPQVSA